MQNEKTTRLNVNLSPKMNDAVNHRKELLSTVNHKYTKAQIVEQYVLSGMQRDGYKV